MTIDTAPSRLEPNSLRKSQHQTPVPQPTSRRIHGSGRQYRSGLQRQAVRHFHARAATGLAALLDYVWPGDAIVVVGIDRLGRNAAEVMAAIRELPDRQIVLKSLREGIDTSNATGRMVAGVLASLAELELELVRERRAAAREARRARGQHIGRPKALDQSKADLAQRMHASGELRIRSTTSKGSAA